VTIREFKQHLDNEQVQARDDVRCLMLEPTRPSSCRARTASTGGSSGALSSSSLRRRQVPHARADKAVIVQSADGKHWRFERSSIEFELHCDMESLLGLEVSLPGAR